MRKSEEISWERFNQLRVDADILEQDEYGIKVLRLASGDIFKVFRVKSIVSGARIYSYARRFCRNAERLQKLKVPTVGIKQLYHFQDSTNTAVLYQPLAGETLRDMAYKQVIPDAVFETLGKFIARLHEDGVHFRSLHLGNIVLSPEGNLGLIDVSDMSIYPWRLQCSTRLRSFRHFYRYPKDNKQLGKAGNAYWQLNYFSNSVLSQSCIMRLKNGLEQLDI